MDPRAKKSLGLLLARLLGPGKGHTGTGGNRIPFTIEGPGDFSLKYTYLGKFSHGYFDVQYHNKTGQVWVMLRVKYKFEDGISKTNRTSFKHRLKQAVAAWDNADVYWVVAKF